MDKKEIMKDPKVKAMMTVIEDTIHLPYEDSLKKQILTKIEKNGIVFLLDLPENHSFDFYYNKVDEYIYNLVKKDF